MHLRMKWKLDLWAIDCSMFFLESGVYEQHKECFLRRLLRDCSGTTPIEVNNFDNSNRRSLHSTPRVMVFGQPGPVFHLYPCFLQALWPICKINIWALNCFASTCYQAKKAWTELNANLMTRDWIPSIRILIQEKVYAQGQRRRERSAGWGEGGLQG